MGVLDCSSGIRARLKYVDEVAGSKVAVAVPVPTTSPARPSLLQFTAEAHSQPPFQVGPDMLVAGECVGGIRKAEQIALGDGGVSIEATERKPLLPEVEDEGNISPAKAHKYLIQALNSRISSRRTSRCSSLGP